MDRATRRANARRFWRKDRQPDPCSAKTPGRPRLGRGICKLGQRHRIYVNRAQARRLRDLVCLSTGLDLEGDEIACLEVPVPSGW
jgi:hypothetical protein